ncbi:MAG: VWA domain-containing protein, partial [Gemmataceae bacterium]
MSTVSRLRVVGVVLTLAVTGTAAHLWGDPSSSTGKDRILNGHIQPAVARTETNLDEALAASKFSQQPVVTYRSQADELLFALQVRPTLAETARRPRDVLVLVDTSASQAGLPLAAARQLCAELTKRLPPGDRLALWTLNIPKATRDLSGGFQAPGSPRLTEALAALEAEFPSGATDLHDGLARAIDAFKQHHQPGRQHVILLLGDGRSSYRPLTNKDR